MATLRDLRRWVPVRLLTNSSVQHPGAALDVDLSNCSDTSLQYLSRHWITSFQLLKTHLQRDRVCEARKPFLTSKQLFREIVGR